MANCIGEHRYYVPESGTVANETGLWICGVIVCVACGESKSFQHKIADGGFYTVTAKQKEKQKET